MTIYLCILRWRGAYIGRQAIWTHKGVCMAKCLDFEGFTGLLLRNLN